MSELRPELLVIEGELERAFQADTPAGTKGILGLARDRLVKFRRDYARDTAMGSMTPEEMVPVLAEALRQADGVRTVLFKTQREAVLARQECVTFLLALEEISRWPEIPGIPYMVKEPGSAPMERQISPQEVRGIMTAIHKHAVTLMPTAARVVQDEQLVSGMARRISELEKVVRGQETATKPGSEGPSSSG